jgi:hypothetical protein
MLSVSNQDKTVISAKPSPNKGLTEKLRRKLMVKSEYRTTKLWFRREQKKHQKIRIGADIS